MIRQLVHNRKGILGLLIALSVLFIVGLFQLRPDFSFDAFFPKDDPDYQYYMRYQEQFSESTNQLISVALKAPGQDIYDAVFLEKADSIFTLLGQLEGIDSMITATGFVEYRRSGLGVRGRPFLRYNSETALEKTREKVANDSLFLGSFVSRDQRYVVAYLFMDRAIFDKPFRDVVNDQITALLESTGLNFQVSGQPYIRTQYIKKLVGELLMFLSMSALLLIGALWVLYRTFWGVMLPLITAFGALLWTLGFMGLTGEPLGILSNLLIPIMFVVSMSSVIHLMTKYLALSQQGLGRKEALAETLEQIGLATFLTNFTTAIGFGALMVSRLMPIKMFGFYAAAGVFFTFIMAIGVLTYGLLSKPVSSFSKSSAFADSPRWDVLLGKIDHFIFTYPRQIAAFSLFLLAASIFFTSRIPLNNFLLQDMHEKDPVAVSMRFFEEQFYGLRPFELALEVKDNVCIDDRLMLEEIIKIENYLRGQGSFSPFLSPVTLVRNVNYLYHYSRPGYFVIPESQDEIDELVNFISLNQGDELIKRVMNEDRSWGRISSRLPDIGSEAFDIMAEDIHAFIAKECNTELFDYKITGQAALTDRNLAYLRDSLLKGLLIAFILIAIIMGALFRSAKMLLVSLIPNVIPLLLTGGIMGLFGITLSTSTAIVFVIAFGIAVDDTIHFLARFRLERSKGHDIDTAIHHTVKGTGKAIILASFVLLCGFSLLMASNFGGTFNTGFFTAMTIIFALLADLFLLPILLRWFYRK